MKFLSLSAALSLAVLICSPAFSQNYHYNYGSGRIINQSQSGYSRPSSTYIGPGTLSQTAQGKNPTQASGVSNPGLPKVPWGANIRTPGDAYYVQTNQGNYWQKPAPQKRRILNPYRFQQPPRPQGNFYIPGQNNTNASGSYGYGGQQQGGFYNPGPGGTATYAETDAGGGARSF